MQSTRAYIDEEYRIIKTVGHGYHSDVLLAVKGTQQFAIKKFKKETADLSVLEDELKFIQQLDHKNIIKLHKVKREAIYRETDGSTQPCFVIVLEYVEGGDLFDYIHKCGRLSPEISRSYFQMLLDALHHIHSKQIAHRDIKLQNILLDHNFVLKMTDFGFSTSIKNGRLKSRLGTEGYKAPEIELRDYDGKEVDLFAAGVVLFIMYAGCPPFLKTTKTDTYYNFLIDKNFNAFWTNHDKNKPIGFFTQEFKDLIEHMFLPVTEERYSMEQVRTHKWTTGTCATLETIFEELSKRQKVVDVEREKARVAKEKMRKMMKEGNVLGMRDSPQFANFFAILDQITADFKGIPEVKDVTQKDLVLNEDPKYFVAFLKEFLKQEKNTNLIAENDEEEVFFISINEEKFSIKIKLLYGVLAQSHVCQVIVHLFKYKQNKLVVRFEGIDKEGLNFREAQLINILKDEFDYLQSR